MLKKLFAALAVLLASAMFVTTAFAGGITHVVVEGYTMNTHGLEPVDREISLSINDTYFATFTDIVFDGVTEFTGEFENPLPENFSREDWDSGLFWGWVLVANKQGNEKKYSIDQPLSFKRVDDGILFVSCCEDVGSIIVTKTDGEEKPLAGAKILLKSTDDPPQIPDREIITGADGLAEFENLPLGNYSIEEIEAPDGYARDVNVYSRVVDGDGEIVTLTIVNEPEDEPDPEFGRIIVTKVDDGGEPLAGARILLKSTDDPPQIPDREIITGADGLAEFENLPLGNYSIEEIEAPDGYARDVNVYDRVVDEDGETVTLTIVNEPEDPELGRIIVTKKDRATGGVLAGAVIRLTSTDNPPAIEAPREITTGADGVAEFENLPLGNYSVQEISAPDGYLLNSAAQAVLLETEGQEILLDILNDRDGGGDENDDDDDDDDDDDPSRRTTITVEEDTPPLAGRPPITINDDPTPLAQLPTTGGSRGLTPASLLALLAGAVLVQKKSK